MRRPAAGDPVRICPGGQDSAVTELTGHSRQSSWFTFLNDLRREAPVIQKNTSVLYDGSIVTESYVEPGGSSHGNVPQTVEKWRQWSYYKLKAQEFDP